MQISKETVLAVVPKGTKKITANVLRNLGLQHDYAAKYIIEDAELFQKSVWAYLTDQQKLELLLSEISEHRQEIDDLRNSVANLEYKMTKMRLSFE
jgi:hypothetical protein